MRDWPLENTEIGMEQKVFWYDFFKKILPQKYENKRIKGGVCS